MIPVIYTWARSGATVLNKCLSAMGHLVLSEVHPKINSGQHAPRWQAVNWHGIKSIPSGTPWTACILQLDKIAKESSRSLILRDWTVNSFYASKDNKYSPIGELRAHKILGDKCKPVVFVRNAIDCALSFAAFHNWERPALLNRYAAGYLTYVRQLIGGKAGVSIFRYENFCKSPDEFLVNFCAALGVPFLRKWQDFGNVTNVWGDTYPKRSRAAQAKQIKPLTRRRVANSLDSQIVRNNHLHAANKLLGY